MEKWLPGTILYVTGLSGSGKTTTAEKLAKDDNVSWMGLDVFCMCAKNTKENSLKKIQKFTDGKDRLLIAITANYINNLPDSEFNYTKGSFSQNSYDEQIKEFNHISNIAMDFCKYAEGKLKNSKIKYVIEGTQLFECDPMWFDWLKEKPMHIVGTGSMKSFNRVIYRTMQKQDRSLSDRLKMVLLLLRKSKMYGFISDRFDNMKSAVVNESLLDMLKENKDKHKNFYKFLDEYDNIQKKYGDLFYINSIKYLKSQIKRACCFTIAGIKNEKIFFYDASKISDMVANDINSYSMHNTHFTIEYHSKTDTFSSEVKLDLVTRKIVHSSNIYDIINYVVKEYNDYRNRVSYLIRNIGAIYKNQLSITKDEQEYFKKKYGRASKTTYSLIYSLFYLLVQSNDPKITIIDEESYKKSFYEKDSHYGMDISVDGYKLMLGSTKQALSVHDISPALSLGIPDPDGNGSPLFINTKTKKIFMLEYHYDD